MSEPIVTVGDLRSANLCSRGAKQWFEMHGLDFRTFLREGYPVSVIEATEDALAMRVATITRERAALEQSNG